LWRSSTSVTVYTTPPWSRANAYSANNWGLT
jgi:hypothetical protein